MYYAITCGIYGKFMHTAFANQDNYVSKYNAMKNELTEFIDQELHQPKANTFYDAFISRY